MTTYEYLLDRKNNNLPVVPERIVCAANRAGNVLFLSVRHWDEQMTTQYWRYWESGGCKPQSDFEQGFYTNWQRFVTRKEAMVIAREQGQIYRPEGTHNLDVLYSECLY